MEQTDGWTDGDAAGDDIQSKINAEVGDYFKESTIKTSRRYSGLRWRTNSPSWKPDVMFHQLQGLASVWRGGALGGALNNCKVIG